MEKKDYIEIVERIISDKCGVTVEPDRFQELIRMEAALASARHAGIKRAVMKDREISEAPLMPPPTDTSVTGLMFDIEKDAAGFPIRQCCIFQDNVEYRMKVYLRHRPDGNAPWNGWELKGTMN